MVPWIGDLHAADATGATRGVLALHHGIEKLIRLDLSVLDRRTVRADSDLHVSVCLQDEQELGHSYQLRV
ncbi:hypothetical protein [Methylobacterium nodulans]|uniref:hypothetical protein n=1 Tax=Methylobacterium nodulans TaxID=114616 RepID=UPI0005C1C86A|nr:hypothetical protein [Methylobacterium nodulans]